MDRWPMSCPSLLELMRHESGDLEDVPAASLEVHLRSCDACRERLGELRHARTELLDPWPKVHARNAATVIATRLHVERRRHWLGWVRLTAVATGAAALTLTLLPRDRSPRPVAVAHAPARTFDEHADGVRTKGTFSVVMYCRRGEEIFVPNDQTVFQPGDRLRFAYTSSEPGYVAIFGVERDGNLFPYYPEGGLSPLPVAPGRHVLLPDSIELDAQAGEEKVVVIWSPTPWEEPSLRRAVRAAISSRHGDLRNLDKLPGLALSKQVGFSLPRR